MDIEQEIQAKGLTAPRITPADVEADIDDTVYFTAAEGFLMANPGCMRIPESLRLLTFCVLVLRNGFTVTGESACASPENFNEEIGRKIARANAITKVWPLLGFRLRDQLTNFTRNHPAGTPIDTTFTDAVTEADALLETTEAEAKPLI